MASRLRRAKARTVNSGVQSNARSVFVGPYARSVATPHNWTLNTPLTKSRSVSKQRRTFLAACYISKNRCGSMEA